jgi:hypothetical protein
MLSASEFTVGTFGNAEPLSLILPRTKYEQTVLIGTYNGAAAAVFLSGEHAFRFFESAGNDSWEGLIVPNVRIEVDETTVFNPDHGDAPLGCVIRKGPLLTIRAIRDGSMGSSSTITLHDKLPFASDLRAGFKRWQIVIGDAFTKKVLWQPPI